MVFVEAIGKRNTKNNPKSTYGKKFVASTLFSVPDIDNNNTAKYASIIYSYNNESNFKSANVNFYNGRVYVSLESVKDGVITTFPKWPGIPYTKSVKAGNNLNLTISVDGNSEALMHKWN